MKIKYTWFKDTGKYYEEGQKDIPDNLFLFSDDLILAINPSLDFWLRRADAGWYLMLDNAEITPEESLAGKFMTSLWTPENVRRKLEKTQIND
jgi:hypothetical protein